MTRDTKTLFGIVVAGLCVLAGLSILGNGKSDAARRAAYDARRALAIQTQTSSRTECVRGVSAELDHAHWEIIGELFNATSREEARDIGRRLTDLPTLIDVANHGGRILDVELAPCPPAPVPRNGGKP